MTIEELSHASADRYADRMMHDVKSASQIRFPPRPPATFSARESLETPTDGMVDVISARAMETTEPITTHDTPHPKYTRQTRTVQERFQDFYTDFESLEPILFTHLSEDDKNRFMRAIRGPRSLHRPEITTIIVAILVVIITSMVCLNRPPPPPLEIRSRATHPTFPPPSSSSTTSFNIDRILKPLNQHH